MSGKIPIYQGNEIVRRTGALNRSYLNPNAFGAQVGRATQGLANAISGVAAAGAARQRKKDQTEAQLRSANQSLELQLGLQEDSQNAPADGSGLTDNAVARLDELDQQALDGITDPELRKKVEIANAKRRAAILPRVNAQETQQAATHAKNQLGEAMDGFYRTVQTDPSLFDEIKEQGLSLINEHYALRDADKKEIAESYLNDLASYQLQAIIDNASTLEGADVAMAALENSEAGSHLSPKQFAAYKTALERKREGIQSGLVAKTENEANGLMQAMKDGRQIPPDELRKVTSDVIAYGNAKLRREWEEAVGIKTYADAYWGQNPERVRDAAKIKSGKGSSGNEFVDIAVKASGLDPEYFMIMFGKESSFRTDAKNAKSSATGLGQFIDSTWLKTIKTHAKTLGISDQIAGMSNSELLELRKNGKVNAAVSGIFTLENAASFRKSMGREPSNEELYLMHFMGTGGGIKFVRNLRHNPEGVAEASSQVLAANRTIYFDKGGNRRTNNQVYQVLTRRFGSATSAAYRDAGYRRKGAEQVQKAYEKGMKNDPALFVQDYVPHFFEGVEFNIETGDGMAGRFEGIMSAREALGTPDIPLLTNDELEQITSRLDSMSSEDRLAYAKKVHTELGSGASEFYDQMEDKFPAMAFAGKALAADKANYQMANDVMKGAETLRALGTDDKPMGVDEYWRNIDSDLKDKNARFPADYAEVLGAYPRLRQQIQHAAEMAYVYRSGGASQDLDEAAMLQAVSDVMGGATVEEINGAKTLLPAGIDGDMFEEALENLTPERLLTLSVEGGVPVYVDGVSDDGEPVYTQIEIDDFVDKVTFEMIGPDVYAVRTRRDGGYLLDSNATDDVQSLPRDRIYKIRLNAEAITLLAETEPPRENELRGGRRAR